MRRDPRVAGLVEEGERYAELRGVQLTGRVELVDDGDVIADTMVAFLEKYEGVAAGQAAAARPGFRQAAAKMVALRLHADRVVSWDHRKLAAGVPGT